MKKEVKTIRVMASNWKESYTTWTIKGDDNDYVYEEFIEDIFTHIEPYIKRLVAVKYITNQEAGELLKYCMSKVEELRDTYG